MILGFEEYFKFVEENDLYISATYSKERETIFIHNEKNGRNFNVVYSNILKSFEIYCFDGEEKVYFDNEYEVKEWILGGGNNGL